MKTNLPTNPKELKNPNEIISHLTQASLKGINAFIWNRKQGNLNLNEKVKILNLTTKEQLRVECESDIEITEGEEVFLALENGNLVFKTKVIHCIGKKVILHIPSMAKGIERRLSPRKYFKYEEKIDFELNLNLNDESENSTAFLLDMSDTGLCLSLSDETVKKIELNQVITIVRGSKGVGSRKCIVRSIRIFRQANMGRNPIYAIGLEMI